MYSSGLFHTPLWRSPSGRRLRWTEPPPGALALMSLEIRVTIFVDCEEIRVRLTLDFEEIRVTGGRALFDLLALPL